MAEAVELFEGRQCVAELIDHELLARANRALDAANFFLADVRDAPGPYLAIYLLTERKWRTNDAVGIMYAQLEELREAASG